MIKLLDTYAPVSQKQCHDLFAAGWRGICVGAFPGGFAKPLYPIMQAECARTLRNVRAEGGIPQLYTNAAPPWVYPWGVTNHRVWWEETQRAAGDELAKVRLIWLDFEIAASAGESVQGSRFIQGDEVVRFIEKLRTVGVPVVGYSGDWFTGLMHANGQRYDFSGHLDGYVIANYNGRADLAVSPRWPMHPRLVGHQYSGTTYLPEAPGVPFDLNVMDPTILTDKEDGMASKEYEELSERIRKLEAVDTFVRFQSTPTVYRVRGHTLEAMQGFEEMIDQVDGDDWRVEVLKPGTPEYDRYRRYNVSFPEVPAPLLAAVPGVN